MFNRKILFVLTILIIITGPAVLINSPISYVPMTFVALLVSISYIYIFVALRCFYIDVESEKLTNCQRLSETEYLICIENKCHLVLPRVSFSVYLENEEGYIVKNYEYDFIFNPNERKTLKLIMSFPHLGKYRVVVSKIKFYGFIDMLYLYKRTNWKEVIIVTPKRHDIQDYEISTTNPVFSVNYNVVHKIKGGEFNETRQYIQGDPIKNIHWKLSAHSNEMFTKIINADAISGVTVFIDFSYNKNMEYENRLDVYDSMVECAYSCGMYSLSKEYGVSFIYPMNNSPAYYCPSAIEEMRELAYSVPRPAKNEEYSIELLIAEYLNTVVCFDNVIVFTSNVGCEIVELLADCKDKGKFPTLFFVQPEGKDEELDEKAKDCLVKSGINCFLISNEKEFASILGGME